MEGVGSSWVEIVIVRKILTHPGSAHKDDFLACCLLVSKFKVPVIRREPHDEEVGNPEIMIVDVGGVHDPESGNFDHHQFPREHTPICALSLVLKHFGEFQNATRFFDWFETAEWFDSRGPIETARWLGVSNDAMRKLNSPIEVIILNLFSQAQEVQTHTMLWELMKKIGDELFSFLKRISKRINMLDQYSEFWTLECSAKDVPIEVFFLPRRNAMENPSMGIDKYISGLGKSEALMALVYPDQRGSGYTLSRFRDCQNLDFTLVENEPDVHFAHKRGFIAKTSTLEIPRLKDLVLQSQI